jgi:hypothetical protein
VPEPKRRFEVIQGGSGRAEKPLIDTGTVGEDKPKFRPPKPSSGGRGGGTQAVRLATLEQSVGWAWKAIGSIFTLGLIGMISLYFLLANRIDDRYDKIGAKLDRVADQISDLRVGVAKAEMARPATASAAATAHNEGNAVGELP